METDDAVPTLVCFNYPSKIKQSLLFVFNLDFADQNQNYPKSEIKVVINQFD